MESAKVRVLFVCLGNICRSPAAEGTFRHLVDQSGLADRFDIDSAGTAAYHTGEPPNAHSTRVAAGRGISLGGRARQFTRADFKRFDYILAMDRSNYGDMLALAHAPEERERVIMFRKFDPEPAQPERDVPDPYYGGLAGFENVQDILLAAGENLLQWLVKKHGLR